MLTNAKRTGTIRKNKAEVILVKRKVVIHVMFAAIVTFTIVFAVVETIGSYLEGVENMIDVNDTQEWFGVRFILVFGLFFTVPIVAAELSLWNDVIYYCSERSKKGVLLTVLHILSSLLSVSLPVLLVCTVNVTQPGYLGDFESAFQSAYSVLVLVKLVHCIAWSLRSKNNAL